jgi:hypothetical protein
MKNIHLMPTDKPSRLRYFDSKLEIMSLIPKKSDIVFQNIYITSDEEIKAGDKILNPTNEVQTCIGLEKGIGTDNICWIKVKETTTLQQILNSQKIILTTDPELIKDGVQAIDDTFLEWFVNNPNFENVEVERDSRDVGNHLGGIATEYGDYEIIIPQEEPKQETLTYTEAVKKEERIFNSIMMKQETLEEAAEKYVKSDLKKTPLYWLFHDTFKDGAKWQAKRMYSEEDMINFHKWAYQKNRIEESDKTTKELLKEWFEQFKNK